jgi:hypothetical protein
MRYIPEVGSWVRDINHPLTLYRGLRGRVVEARPYERVVMVDFLLPDGQFVRVLRYIKNLQRAGAPNKAEMARWMIAELSQ